MKRRWLVVSAVALDALVGDPCNLPHPIRAMGVLIAIGEPLARQIFAPTTRGERMAGTALAICVTGATCIAGIAVQEAGGLLETVASASTLALRNLLDEANVVRAALLREDIVGARAHVGRIVGRDTEGLDASAIARATIETLAESACDGVVAPLYYLMCGGLPGALTYKAINTLDSMIGHIESPYRDFGRWAARCDDAATFLPARITAWCIVAAAGILEGSASIARRVWHRDGALHRSPNAGQSEAAMAGALRVRLGGSNRYDGVQVESATLGREFREAEIADIGRAMRIVAVAALIADIGAFAIAAMLDA